MLSAVTPRRRPFELTAGLPGAGQSNSAMSYAVAQDSDRSYYDAPSHSRAFPPSPYARSLHPSPNSPRALDTSAAFPRSQGHAQPQQQSNYTTYPMAQSYADHDALLSVHTATQPAPPDLVSPLLPPPSASSAHPSRAPSPVQGIPATSYYAHFDPLGGDLAQSVTRPATPEQQHQQQQQQQPPFHHSRSESTGAGGGAGGATAYQNGAQNLLKVLQWTPQRGDEGTQVTIVLDAAVIRNARSSQFSAAQAQFGPGSPALAHSSPRKNGNGGGGNGEVNRKFSVLFGQAKGPTKHTRASQIDGNGVGQSMNAGPNEEDAFVVLSTFVPERSAMGNESRIMVTVEVKDEMGVVLESSATPTRVNLLKRAGDALVSDRDAPGLRSPSRSMHNSPVRQQAEWQSPSIPHHQPVSTLNSPSLGYASPALGHSAPPPPPLPHPSDPNDPLAAAPPGPPLAQAINRQPELIRTSQIHAPKNGGYGATYSHKVVLKLQNDLNTMAMGWSNEEWTNRRRLIQFWPQQDGNIINVAFRPITQAEYVQNSIVISCIFRDEWNECFVTSVDTIYLLEALVGSRFTVEEKNRIRRNLEGFKPMTVSKSKPDAEPFFKLIMGFPNPKPRNIEKDVKVFPWKILANALKKIMSKYSANYPLGPDGTPLAGGAVPPPAPAPEASGSGTPLQLNDPRFPPPPISPPFTSPHITHASPHLSHHAAIPSPHMPHASPHIPQQSPHLGPPSHAHASYHNTPQLGDHHFRSPNPGSDMHHSPAVGGPLPHSPLEPHGGYPNGGGYLSAGQAAYGAGPPNGVNGGGGGGGGDTLDVYNGSGSYPYASQASPQPHHLPQQHHHQQHHNPHAPQHQQLFPAHEDYGVPLSHHDGGGLLPPASVSGGGGTNHLRSYSEGVQYASPNPNGGALSAFASPVPPQGGGGGRWGEPLPGGGGGTGGGIALSGE
ncbi:hypothetical protein JCM8547_005054 [Rhodosporidiobolus lusitaniae]